MKQSDILRQRRAAAYDQMVALRDAAAREDRDLTAPEDKRWSSLDAEIVRLDREIDRAEIAEGHERQGIVPITGPGPDGSRSSFIERAADAGNLIAANESITEHLERSGRIRAGSTEADFGRWLRAAIMGDLPALQALQGDIGPQGGYAVPAGAVTQIVDLARAEAAVVRAGAVTIPVETRDYTWPRLASDPTAAWVNEAATIPVDANMSFDAVSSTVHKLTTLVKASRELVDDVAEFGAFMTSALGQALGLALDLAGLEGDGVSKPQGLASFPGVSVVAMPGANGATPTGYGELNKAVTAVRTANFEPTSWIAHPRDLGVLAGLVDTTNQPLRPPSTVAGLRQFPTTSIATNLTVGTSTDTSRAYVGDFTRLAFVVRMALDVQLLTERYADEGRYGFLATMRADITPIRETAFAIITGIRP